MPGFLSHGPSLGSVNNEQGEDSVWLMEARGTDGYKKVICPYMNGKNCQTNCALFFVKGKLVKCGQNVMGWLP